MLRVVRGDPRNNRREPEMWPEAPQDDQWSPEEEPREPREPQSRRRHVSDHRDRRQGNLLFERIAFRVAIAFALICGAAALYFTAHNGGLDSLVARRSGEKAAKSTDAPPAPAATAAAPQQSAPPRPAGQAIPNADGLVILIRSSIIALQQANVSGDYAVLRDIGAPSFQQVNSPEKLSQAFADLRGRKMDLAEIAVVSPRLLAEPTIDAKGFLRLTGFFPAASERVNFDLAFQMVSWALALVRNRRPSRTEISGQSGQRGREVGCGCCGRGSGRCQVGIPHPWFGHLAQSSEFDGGLFRIAWNCRSWISECKHT